MPGKLDQISEAIGFLRGDVKGLGRRVDGNTKEIAANRDRQDVRHSENQRAIGDLRDEVSALKDNVEREVLDLKKRVTKVEPIAEGYKVTKLRVAGALSLATVVLVGLGMIAQRLLGEVVVWAWRSIVAKLGL